MATWNDIEAGVEYLRQRTEEMRDHGMENALADAEYRKRKAIAILDERQNCAQAVYEADKESINTMKLKLRVLDAQIARDWQAAGQRGY